MAKKLTRYIRIMAECSIVGYVISWIGHAENVCDVSILPETFGVVCGMIIFVSIVDGDRDD